VFKLTYGCQPLSNKWVEMSTGEKFVFPMGQLQQCDYAVFNPQTVCLRFIKEY